MMVARLSRDFPARNPKWSVIVAFQFKFLRRSVDGLDVYRVKPSFFNFFPRSVDLASLWFDDIKTAFCYAHVYQDWN